MLFNWTCVLLANCSLRALQIHIPQRLEMVHHSWPSLRPESSWCSVASAGAYTDCRALITLLILQTAVAEWGQVLSRTCPAGLLVQLWHERALSKVEMTLWGALQWKNLVRGDGIAQYRVMELGRYTESKDTSMCHVLVMLRCRRRISKLEGPTATWSFHQVSSRHQISLVGTLDSWHWGRSLSLSSSD